MMDDIRSQRLQKKYQSQAEAHSTNRQIAAPKDLPTAGQGGGGMGRRFSGGKPKNLQQIVKRLYSYLREERIALAFALFFVILHNFASVYASYMLRPIINDHIVPVGGVGDAAGLAKALGFMGSLYMCSMLSRYTMTNILLTVSQKAQRKIRKDLFTHLQQLPVRFFDQSNTGETMSRFTNDIDTVGEVLNNTVAQILSGVITLTSTIGLMLYTNVPVALISLIFLPLTKWILDGFTKRGRSFYSAQQAALGTLNGFIEESISGQKVVKVFCHEEISTSEFVWLNQDYRKKQLSAQSLASAMMPAMLGLNNLNYVVVAGVGLLFCINGRLDLGGLTVLVNYSRQFARPLNDLSGQMNTLYSALAGAERVFEILDTEPEPADLPDAVTLENCTGALSVQNVYFGYNAKNPAVRDITFEVSSGQKVAFVGSTGAGKTTVANLIPRFYDISDGQITIDGIDIRQIKRADLRKHVNIILQDTHLFTKSVMENIRYGRLDATDEEVIAAAEMANAHSFILQLKDGYDTVLEHDGSNLSQGQRQLLGIARATLSEAPILIMDEATSSVDTRAEKSIEKGLDHLASSRATIVIAHRLSTVRNADLILVMEQGRIIERGDHDTLLQRGGRYFELYTGLAELA
ncbi:MAG: ABC transporter ATP-binding protein/permease [Eubacteriaceae bacterium]|nr:ABC transporter ATP-binding protein/permease [Eubacteriaceae bacterium]